VQHLIEPVSNMVVKYDVTNAAIEELSKRYAPLKIKECEAKEYADLLEKERQENLKPDKKKLENWANKLLGIETVSLTADDAVSIAEEALDKIYEIADWVLAETSKL